MAYFAAFFAEFGPKTDPKAFFSLVFTKTSMKQTNNAIKFLMAQYRAIFKSAYFKGLTSAVLLTAGLAAGAAQAAGIEDKLGADAENATDVVINTGSDNTFTSTTAKYANSLTITGNGVTLDSTSTSSGDVAQLYFKDLKVTNGATLTLNGTEGTHAGFQGVFDDPDFSKATSNTQIDNATLNISGNSSIQSTNVTFNKATVNITGASGGVGAEDGHNDNPVAGRGELTINNSTVKMDGTRVWLWGSYANISNSEITLDGSASGSNSDAAISSVTTNLVDTNISVSASKFGRLAANTLNIDDTTVISNTGTLTLGREGGVVNLNGGTIMNTADTTGHIYLVADLNMTDGLIDLNSNYGIIGAADDQAATPVSADITATGGQILVDNSQIQVGNVTLGGDVEVKLGGVISNGTKWNDNAMLGAMVNAIDTDTAHGNFTIQDNAKVTLGVSSQLYGANFNINGGSITFEGTGLASPSQDADGSGAATNGSSFIRAFGTNGSINLNDGTLQLASGKSGGLYGAHINLDGGTINNNGVLQLGQDLSFKDGRANTSVTISDTAFSGAGTLQLGTNTDLVFAGNDTVFNGVLDASASGTSVAINGKLTFNGDANKDTVLDFKSSGSIALNSTGTLVINDTEQTIGLSYTAGTAGKDGAATLGSFSLADGDNAFKGFTSGSNGLLRLDLASFAESVGELSTTDATTLKTQLGGLLTEGDSNYTGIIYLDGLTVNLGENVVDSNNSANWSDVEDVLTTGTGLEQLEHTQVNASSSAQVAGAIGAVNVTDGNTVNVSTTTTTALAGHQVNGVQSTSALTTYDEGSKVAGLGLKAGSNVQLTAANGTVGAITVTTPSEGEDSAGTFTVAAGSNIAVVSTGTNVADLANEEATITYGDIGTATAKIKNLDSQGVLTAKDIHAENTSVQANASVNAENVTTETVDVKANAAVAVTDTFTATSGGTIAGVLQADTAELTNVTVDGGVLQDITALNVTDSLSLTNDATATVSTLTVGAGASVSVGNGEAANGTATLLAQNIEFADTNGWVTTDPTWGTKASLIATEQVGAETAYDKGTAGVLTGNMAALQNGITVIGSDDETYIRDLFAQYTDPATGSLKQNDVGAIFYVEGTLNINDGAHLVADSTHSKTQFDAAIAASDSYAQLITGNDIYIGNNSILAIDTDAAIQDVDNQRAAIVFNKSTTDATVYTNGGKVVLVGDNLTTNSKIQLFDNAGTGNVVIDSADNNGLTVESLNGLMQWTLAEGSSGDQVFNLELNSDRVDTIYNDVSSPVKNTLISYAAKYNDWSSNNPTDQLHGAATGYTYDSAAGTVSDGTNTYQVSDYVVINRGTDEEPNWVVYEKAYNALLDDIVMNQSNARDAETVARFSAFGGVAQSAMAAGASTYDAISGRMGVGANGTNITVADNMQGAAIWLTPVYKSSEADGFDADGLDYGVDVDLYGVALGADYTLANGLRFGAMFNVGSGEVDGKDLGSNVSNDFDYYGFGAYVGYSIAAFSIVGDISYTVADNDVEANLLNGGKLSESLDSSNFSVGITGQYQVDTGSVLVTPHAGLRYSSIDVDDYTIADTANVDSDDLGIFSIPVGVTIATEFTSNEWTIKPSFDFTVTGNFGDDSTDGTVHWAGVENLSTSVSSEVIDSFTYGATLGLGVQNGNFGLGLGVNYTGSSNTDEFGVQANARFVF